MLHKVQEVYRNDLHLMYQKSIPIWRSLEKVTLSWCLSRRLLGLTQFWDISSRSINTLDSLCTYISNILGQRSSRWRDVALHIRMVGLSGQLDLFRNHRSNFANCRAAVSVQRCSHLHAAQNLVSRTNLYYIISTFSRSLHTVENICLPHVLTFVSQGLPLLLHSSHHRTWVPWNVFMLVENDTELLP